MASVYCFYIATPLILCEELMRFSLRQAPVAQLVEQWPLKPLVEGSSPSGRT